MLIVTISLERKHSDYKVCQEIYGNIKAVYLCVKGGGVIPHVHVVDGLYYGHHPLSPIDITDCLC